MNDLTHLTNKQTDYRRALCVALSLLDKARRRLVHVQAGGRVEWCPSLALRLVRDEVQGYERLAEQYASGVARTGAAIERLKERAAA